MHIAKRSNKKPGKGTVQRDLALTRRRILEAAAREFAERGLDGARIDRIASCSSANKAMIYYIFGNKEALHLAVLENLFEEKTRSLDLGIFGTNVPTSDLLSTISSYLNAFLNNPDATRMIFHDLASGARTLRRLKEKRPDLFQPFFEISNVLKAQAKAGNIRPLDSDKAVLTAILLLMALPVFLPHTDLLQPKRSPAHRSLSSPEAWKSFLMETVFRVLQDNAA